ncbi:50S ribosomal protein L15 [Candidatus Wolfebacteria bacterium CG03_land_8_20_14_0_80_40_12]|uniref:Large ribosomal subunit protein uL15 n=1 Tax=Candidatus Wolfebacteria bacterium CG03_land_8_20_14_0_80_40_12 TaxID=1975069 RepID=A0A2M7B695_9BACT|nr:MAG: 50S ribosomal protein L15 [Candidatus Wolfebacteria bacterium CG03_land_8_20_14_0_80_40_12]
MQLHELKPIQKIKKKKRIGRGGKRGTYSGRGQKGQKSRAGHRIRPAARDLIQRLPKIRGYNFKSLKLKPAIINIDDLTRKIKGNLVNKEILLQAGLIRKSDRRVKILAEGEIKRALTIQGLELSESAKKKIETAGGSITH